MNWAFFFCTYNYFWEEKIRITPYPYVLELVLRSTIVYSRGSVMLVYDPCSNALSVCTEATAEIHINGRMVSHLLSCGKLGFNIIDPMLPYQFFTRHLRGFTHLFDTFHCS